MYTEGYEVTDISNPILKLRPGDLIELDVLESWSHAELDSAKGYWRACRRDDASAIAPRGTYIVLAADLDFRRSDDMVMNADWGPIFAIMFGPGGLRWLRPQRGWVTLVQHCDDHTKGEKDV